jgi:hypothetical protein
MNSAWRYDSVSITIQKSLSYCFPDEVESFEPRDLKIPDCSPSMLLFSNITKL